uniref:Uncharacterized protein n=1 Tax=Moniliophthora roreri TaxID=221103 RepID=A0A0W0F6Q7_MONRR
MHREMVANAQFKEFDRRIKQRGTAGRIVPLFFTIHTPRKDGHRIKQAIYCRSKGIDKLLNDNLGRPTELGDVQNDLVASLNGIPPLTGLPGS